MVATHVICSCGELAPIILVGDDEPDDDIREVFYGKRLVKCEKCHSFSEVNAALQAQLDDAERIGKLNHEPPRLVRLVRAEDDVKRGVPIVMHPKGGD
jgi:hypothetical protein